MAYFTGNEYENQKLTKKCLLIVFSVALSFPVVLCLGAELGLNSADTSYDIPGVSTLYQWSNLLLSFGISKKSTKQLV